MSCHLEIPLEFSDRAALSAAEAAAKAEASRGPCAGDTDSARSFPHLHFWPNAAVLAPATNGPSDAAWGSALPAPRLSVCACIVV